MTADGVLSIHRSDPGDPPAPARDPAQPVLYYDLASAESYLAVERCMQALGVVPAFEPVALGPPAFRCAEELDIHRGDIARRAAERNLQPLRWPDGWPDVDTTPALLAATYAKRIGKVAAFTLAALRQAFAGGRDLGDVDTVLIAGAACEIHPRALLKALETASIRAELDRATAAAQAAGVTTSPSVVIGSEVFPGDSGLDAARVALESA
jgi:2-hydroxychromene-2-carboxylate isomerase